ncbi:MAG: general secretion pathway protein GspK [Aestuariibacter sp.]
MLVLVLWILVLLTVLIGSYIASARIEAAQTRFLVDQTKVTHAAIAGVHIAAANLLEGISQSSSGRGMDNGLTERWIPDGRSYEVRFEKSMLKIRIFHELGKIDINHASPEILQQVLRSSGASESQSQSIVAAMQDWRDSDDYVHLNGAEFPEYLAAGLNHGPRNAPFRQIEELQQVLGITFSLYRRIEPFITVFSGRSSVDVRYASARLLQMLTGVSHQEIQAFVALRDETLMNASRSGVGNLFGEVLQVAEATQPQWFNVNEGVNNSLEHTYTVEVQFVDNGQHLDKLSATIRLTKNNRAYPFKVLRWNDAPKIDDGRLNDLIGAKPTPFSRPLDSFQNLLLVGGDVD